MILTKFFTKGWGKPDHLKSIFEFRRQLAKKVRIEFKETSSMSVLERRTIIATPILDDGMGVRETHKITRNGII